MNATLLNYSYMEYSKDTPHDVIIQSLVSKGASYDEAISILDLSIVKYCTESGETLIQEVSSSNDGNGIGEILKILVTIIGLGATVMQCAN